MNKKIKIKGLWWAIFIIILATFFQPLAAAKDSRFFGTYCGEATYRYCYTVIKKILWWEISRRTECRTIQITDMKVHLDYKESRTDGIIHGRGVGYYGSTRIPFVVAGSVVSTGRVRGHLRIPGESPYRGEMRLSMDGMTLTINAFGGRATLRKDQCGNEPPQVQIVSPDSVDGHPYGDVVLFRGVIVSDEEPDNFPKRRLVWTSNRIDRLIGTGLHFAKNDLPPGPHTITFRAIDAGGLSGETTIDIVIDNSQPNAPEIILPEDNADFKDCQKIVLKGQAYDNEDGFLPGTALNWTSSIDGPLGRGRSRIPDRQLSVGRHTLTLTATDSADTTRSTSITINVGESTGNCPPTPVIAFPEHYSGGYATGEVYNLQGTAFDSEDGELRSSNLRWYYKIGANPLQEIGTGNNVPWTIPEVGSDTKVRIILVATDNGGRDGEDPVTAEDWVEIYISPVPLI